MRHYHSKSSGLTFISLCLVLGLIAFFTLLILKIGPIYYENYTIRTTMQNLEKESEILTMSKARIKGSLQSRFDVGYIEIVTANDAVILKRNDYVSVALQYEVVEQIVGNLSVLVEFDEGFEVGTP
jgi:hypothetical protein